MNHLANQHLRVILAGTDSLLAVENHLAAEAYHFAADAFAVETDQGRFSNDTTRPSGVTPTPDGLIFYFAFAQVTLDLIYRLDAANGFVRRSVKIANRTPAGLNVKNLLRLYEQYVQRNHSWLFQGAPRRTDLRLYEAVYHFNLYLWLARFLQKKGGRVHPEFPTGNGQIDLIISYQGQRYGLELKSFDDDYEYQAALQQSARYARQLQLATITVVFFVEAVDDETRAHYEVPYHDAASGVSVEPLLVTTVE